VSIDTAVALSIMATKLINPFPIGSKLRLSVLLDSAKVAPILNELQAKYRGDRSEKRRPFSPSKPILLSIFHLLPSENYDLYRSSLSRLVQKGSRFPVTIERPFATKSTLLASFGFNIRSPEIEALRNELAKRLQRLYGIPIISLPERQLAE
jgi:hypothetical protein